MSLSCLVLLVTTEEVRLRFESISGQEEQTEKALANPGWFTDYHSSVVIVFAWSPQAARQQLSHQNFKFWFCELARNLFECRKLVHISLRELHWKYQLAPRSNVISYFVFYWADINRDFITQVSPLCAHIVSFLLSSQGTYGYNSHSKRQAMKTHGCYHIEYCLLALDSNKPRIIVIFWQ